MCEFCSKHGDGKVWFKNAENYSKDLMSDLTRRDYINDFFTSTIEQGMLTIGRLETLFGKKKRLPLGCHEQRNPLLLFCQLLCRCLVSGP